MAFAVDTADLLLGERIRARVYRAVLVDAADQIFGEEVAAFVDTAVLVDRPTISSVSVRKNVTDYGLQDQVSLAQSDLMKNLKGKTYDLIVTNLPYVNAASMTALPEEFRREPELALASGKDGLDHVRRIIEDAPKHLNPGGLLVAEIGPNRDALEAAFPRLPFTWLDTSDGDQFVFLLRREDFKS